MDDQLPSPPVTPLKREVGRRKIQGTNKIEVVYAIRQPFPPYEELMERVILVEHEEAGRK